MNASPTCPASSRRTSLSACAELVADASQHSCQDTSAEGAESAEREAELDELFADLSDQRHTVLPISSEERATRRARLGQLLADSDRDALVVETSATMEYLTGITWSRSERLFALVVLADGSIFWVCPAFEAARARLGIDAPDGPGGEVIAWDEHEYAFAPLAAELNRRRATRICIEPSMRYTFVGGQDPAPAARALVTELRGRKDAHEVAIMRRANELTQEAIIAASRHIQAGLTGDEIGRLVRHAHQRLGLTGHWDLSLIGPAAAYPHGENRNTVLKRGDAILIDTGGALHGYQSDNTRSWVFDAEPTERQATVWHAVRDSQRAAFDAIAPGVIAGDVDRVARTSLEACGLTRGYSTFTHRLGHGIGMEGHEDPYFDGGSEVILASGMTLSLEPGIYLQGELGIRIEDIIAVTEEGVTAFGDWQRGPHSPE